MKNFLFVFFLFIVLTQGCNHAGDPASNKEAQFKNYINSNTQQQETKNQESKPIVNVAF